MKMKRLVLSLHLNMTARARVEASSSSDNVSGRWLQYSGDSAVRTDVAQVTGAISTCAMGKKIVPPSTQKITLLWLFFSAIFHEKCLQIKVICGVQNTLSEALLNQRASWWAGQHMPEMISSWACVHALPLVWQTSRGCVWAEIQST